MSRYLRTSHMGESVGNCKNYLITVMIDDNWTLTKNCVIVWWCTLHRSDFRSKRSSSVEFCWVWRKQLNCEYIGNVFRRAFSIRTNSYVFAFRSTLQQKDLKSASFREKPWKIIQLAKTCNVSNKLACFCVLMTFSAKDLQKVPHFVENHEKSSIWPKLDIFRTNWHVFAFWSSFQQKLAKSASFREKPWKIIDLAKTWYFSNKVACFCVLINFLAKSCKKCFISWKTMKNPRFGQNLQLFEQTGIMRVPECQFIFLRTWKIKNEIVRSFSFFISVENWKQFYNTFFKIHFSFFYRNENENFSISFFKFSRTMKIKI